MVTCSEMKTGMKLVCEDCGLELSVTKACDSCGTEEGSCNDDVPCTFSCCGEDMVLKSE